MQDDVKYTLIIGLVLICVLSSYQTAQTNSDLNNQKESTVITLPYGSFDVGNSKEGTITIQMVPEAYKQMVAEQNDKDVKYIMLFASKMMPGLEIKFNLQDKVFETGIPSFKSVPIDLLNIGNVHTLAFAYRLGDKQSIYIDGQLIGERPFLTLQSNALSGFVIKSGDSDAIYGSVPSLISYSEKQLTLDEIRQIQ
ncbi:MAG: hypothetical protein WC471_04725 [Candidatus Woesearchaeota archaeon]